LELRDRLHNKGNIVVGIVHPDGRLLHSIIETDDGWEQTDSPPDLYIAEKLQRVFESTKRFIIVIGGRGSSKSVSIADLCLVGSNDHEDKTYFLREFQSSIKNSVYSLLKSEISRLEMDGFEVQSQSILRSGEDVCQFAGISRNVDSIKSAHGFKRFSVEEAQFLSQESIDVLTPTARNKPNKGLPKTPDELEQESFEGVSMLFVANPESSEDPFSKRFIVPFQEQLDRDGYYEDELHLVVVMNYHDNPWFMESGLETERLWAKDNLSRELYDHVWLGDYNDSVDNSLILGEWFDACLDAHKVLGWAEVGANIASHDPSDEGEDTKGWAMRHGSIVRHVLEKLDGNVNDGGHWATDNCILHNADYFTFDADGMGVALGEQISKDLKEKAIRIAMFKGSEGVDSPDSIYKPAEHADVESQKTNKDVFRNKRAQYYCELRDRIYRTYRWVVHGEYADPDLCVSFDSTIPLIKKLRAELCRMPIKPHGGGLITLYTKEEMKRLFKFASPNLGDSVMMLMRYQSIDNTAVYIPKPINRMKLGGRRKAR